MRPKMTVEVRRFRRLRPVLASFAIFSAFAAQPPAFADSSLGLAYQSLSYTQSGANTINESAVQLGGDLVEYSGRFDLRVSGDVTLLPLSGWRSDYHALDFDALGGLALIRSSRTRLSVLEGVAYSTALINSPSLVGYENAVYGETGLVWAHLTRHRRQFEALARVMYQLNSGGSGMGYGLDGDLRYTLDVRARHPVSVVLESRTLQVLADGASATARTLSLGLAMGL